MTTEQANQKAHAFKTFREAEESAIAFFNAEPAACEMELLIFNEETGKTQTWFATPPSNRDSWIKYVILRGFSINAEPIEVNQVDLEGRQVIGSRWDDKPVYMPKVGDPATYGIGSDSYPYTIVSVSASGKTITARRDQSIAAEGHDYYGSQKYNYFANPNAQPEKFTLRKCGSFRPSGSSCGYLSVGHRRHYSDPHF